MCEVTLSVDINNGGLWQEMGCNLLYACVCLHERGTGTGVFACAST